jgi:hypothetical protein
MAQGFEELITGAFRAWYKALKFKQGVPKLPISSK